MEAAGLEPASGGSFGSASTCLAPSLCFAPRAGRGTAPKELSLIGLVPSAEGKLKGQPCYYTPLRPRREEPKERLPYSLGSESIVVRTYFYAACFTRLTAPRHAAFPPHTPVESIRPRNNKYISPLSFCQQNNHVLYLSGDGKKS